jgi:hypothetical protein
VINTANFMTYDWKEIENVRFLARMRKSACLKVYSPAGCRTFRSDRSHFLLTRARRTLAHSLSVCCNP